MERCARALARSVNYVGAATVEYLFNIETKEFYFLELNPRLQVPHLPRQRCRTRARPARRPHAPRAAAPSARARASGGRPGAQVEHPVTEWISGVNIPSCQLMVGMGVPLSRIPDIRRLYGQDPKGTSQIDFDKDPQIPPSGAHVGPRPLRPPPPAGGRLAHHGMAAYAPVEGCVLRAPRDQARLRMPWITLP